MQNVENWSLSVWFPPLNVINQVESLFLGTADAMRRQILPNIADFMVGKDPADVKVFILLLASKTYAKSRI